MTSDKIFTLEGFAGLFMGKGPDVPPTSLSELKNAEVNSTGEIEQRLGFAQIGTDPLGGYTSAVTGLWRFAKGTGWRQFVAGCYDTLFRATNEATGTWVAASGAILEPNARLGFAQYRDTLYFGSAGKGPFRYDGVTAYTAGLPAPTDAPGIGGAMFGVTSLTAGKHRWKMTYVYGEYGESEAGPPSVFYTATGDDALTLRVPSLVRADVTAIRLYRTDTYTDDDDPAAYIYYRVLDLWTDVISQTPMGDEIKVVAGVPERTSVADHIADDDLGEEVEGDKGLPPSGGIFAVYNERLVVAGSSLYPERLWLSDVGHPDIFPDGYFRDVTTSAGDPITGLHALPGALLILKRNSLCVLTGNNIDEYAIRVVSENVGCLATASVAGFRSGTLFLGTDGVYGFDGVTTQRLSKAIDDLFSAIGASTLQVAAGVVYGHKYFLSYPSQGVPVNDSYVCLDLDTGKWSRGDRMAAFCFSVWEASGDQHYMWFGHAGDGHVYLANVRPYDGLETLIDSEIATQDLDMDLPDRLKEFRRLWADGETLEPLTVSWELDGAAASGTLEVLGDVVGDDWDDMDWDDDEWAGPISGITAFRFPQGTIGRKIKVKVNGTGPGVPWKLKSLRIGYRVKERWR